MEVHEKPHSEIEELFAQVYDNLPIENPARPQRVLRPWNIIM